MIHTWKMLKYKIPVSLYEEFSITDNYTIATTIPRLMLTARCFKWRIVDDWNQLPEFIRMETKLSTFKKQIRTTILERRTQAHIRRPPDPDS